MEFTGDREEQKRQLLPVVKFAVQRALARSGKPSYWDMATLLELAALEGNSREARACVSKMFRTEWESWNPETTADNLRKIKEARQARLGRRQRWLEEIIRHLDGAAHKAANRWWVFAASPPSATLAISFSKVKSSDPPRFRCRYRLGTPLKKGKEQGTRLELKWTIDELAEHHDAFRKPYQGYDPARIKLYGAQLRQAIRDSKKLERAFTGLLDSDGQRRLVIEGGEPHIDHMIWEALPLRIRQVQGPFVALAGNCIVRVGQTDRGPRPGTPSQDGTLLYAWSQPRKDDEVPRLVPHPRHRRILKTICDGSGVDMVTVPNASLARIRAAARRADEGGKPVRALHLLCHGDEVGDAWGLEINAKHRAAVDPTRLNALLHNDLPHLVLLTLHACNSADPGTDTDDDQMKLLGSVADAGYAAGADVVACQIPFTVDGSIIAVQEMYSQLLARRRSLTHAVRATVARLYKDPPHGYHDWAALVLMEH